MGVRGAPCAPFFTMKKGFIVINAYTEASSELNQPKRLKSELEALGVSMEIVRNSPSILHKEGDFAVYADKDKYAARALEKRLRIFNRAEAIEICDDKMLTHLALDGFPMPETIPSLLCYTPSAPVSEALLGEVKDRLGFPVVVKECHGSLGKQVYLARNETELRALAERLKGVPHLYQKLIAESAGRDLRVIVIGGRAVAAMRRTSQTDFRSNAELGGIGEPFPLDREATDLSEAIARTLGLDYCGIDLLFGKDGYLMCEVNSNAFFGAIERVTRQNIAQAYAEHIYRKIYIENAK